jgi:hypothetical protein
MQLQGGCLCSCFDLPRGRLTNPWDGQRHTGVYPSPRTLAKGLDGFISNCS